MSHPSRDATLVFARRVQCVRIPYILPALQARLPVDAGFPLVVDGHCPASLADDAQAGMIRRALGDASEATLAALDRLANENGVVSATVMRMAVRYERARRRAFARELARAS